MTEKQDQAQQQPEALPKPAKSGTAKARGRLPGIAAVVLALAALAASGAALYTLYQFRQQAAARGAAVDRLDTRLGSLQQSLAALQRGRSQLEQRLEQLRQSQQQMHDSLQSLYRKQERDSTDWAVAEIEHLMIIAVHSLTLQKDVGTALAALQAADDRIRNLGDPGLLPVRRQLTSDINALRAVNDVDISGLSLFLSDLVTRVEDLPLREQETGAAGNATAAETAPDRPAWKRLLLGVWHELKSLVVITRTDKGGAALLLPEEKYFLYQNLRLQLESAREAVFRRDTENFHASIDIVLRWLRQYFDMSSTAVGNIIDSLEKMRKVNLDQELPDISSSLESLHAYIKEKSGGSVSRGESAP